MSILKKLLKFSPLAITGLVKPKKKQSKKKVVDATGAVVTSGPSKLAAGRKRGGRK